MFNYLQIDYKDVVIRASNPPILILLGTSRANPIPEETVRLSQIAIGLVGHKIKLFQSRPGNGRCPSPRAG